MAKQKLGYTRKTNLRRTLVQKVKNICRYLQTIIMHPKHECRIVDAVLALLRYQNIFFFYIVIPIGLKFLKWNSYTTVWGSENCSFYNIGKSCQIRFNILPTVYGSEFDNFYLCYKNCNFCFPIL